MRICLLFMLAGLVTFSSLAQTNYSPQQYKYKGKEYFVYPFRISDQTDIPPCAFNLPDGEYILFHEYIFKYKKFGEPPILKDSLKVAGIFSLRNNNPNGPVSYFHYGRKRKGLLSKRRKAEMTGTYKNGMKEGTWISTDYKEKNKLICNYKDGLKYGKEAEYAQGKPVSIHTYRNDTLIDTSWVYYLNGKLQATWDNQSNETTKKPETFFYESIVNSHARPTIGAHFGIKSFLRCYDYNGEKIVDAKFENNYAVYFDTIRIGLKKFVAIPLKDNRFLLKEINPPAGLLPQEEYYVDEFIYKSKGYLYDSLKPAFYESDWADVEEIEDGDAVDTIVGVTRFADHTRIFHFLPRYNFCYAEVKEISGNTRYLHKPDSMDSESCSLYYTDSLTTDDDRFKYVQVRKTYPPYHCHIPEQEPLKVFDRFLLDFAELTPESETSVAFGLNEEINGEEYYTINEKLLYNNLPFSGKLYEAPDLDNAVDRYSVKFVRNDYERQLSQSNYLNGQRHSLQQELQIGYTVDIPYFVRDLKKFFFDHPDICGLYTETNFENGKLNGVCRQYNSEGSMDVTDFNSFAYSNKPHLAIEAQYNNNLRNGEYKEFFASGNLSCLVNFRNGVLHGPVKTWSSPGILSAEAVFDNGLLQGKVKTYRDSMLATEADYDKGKLSGVFTVYSALSAPDLIIKARGDTLLEKILFFSAGAIKERILFNPDSGFLFDESILSSENILSLNLFNYDYDEYVKFNADVTEYFEDGKLFAKGKIVAGRPQGVWMFYNENGVKVNVVNFKDSMVLLPGEMNSTYVEGFIDGYYNNGKIRCKGLIKDFESSFDCVTKQEKVTFDITYADFWTYDGVQTILNGNGVAVITDENGLKLAEGEVRNMKPEGKWKYFDPNGKLNEIGNFVNGKKDGLWFKGDLEGLNFEDAACFDPANKEAQAQYEYQKNVLNFTKTLFINGQEFNKTYFETNKNTVRSGMIIRGWDLDSDY